MLESYVRNAPKRHELYNGHVEARAYACREYGGKCAEWLIKEAIGPNGHAVATGTPIPERLYDGPKKTAQWQKIVPASEPQ